MKYYHFFVVFSLLLVACGPDTGDEGPPETTHNDEADDGQENGGTQKTPTKQSIYAKRMHLFRPGANHGYGKDKLPEIVLGPPSGAGTQSGSLEVVSLGVGGSMILDFGEEIKDIDGPELFVFENPFFISGDPKNVFAELGRVSVSLDTKKWTTFPCQPDESNPETWSGCAGKTPTLSYDPATQNLSPEVSGGDAFDLADINVSAFRYVKIEDIGLPSGGTRGNAPTAGFDLDAVGAIVFK